MGRDRHCGGRGRGCARRIFAPDAGLRGDRRHHHPAERDPADPELLAARRPGRRPQRRNETAVLESKVVQNAAKKELGHKPDVSISSNPTSDVVSVSARSTNADAPPSMPTATQLRT